MFRVFSVFYMKPPPPSDPVTASDMLENLSMIIFTTPITTDTVMMNGASWANSPKNVCIAFVNPVTNADRSKVGVDIYLTIL